ncbi:4Fe-4S dicluster domain-containing protein [Protofrankia symbiont of Coriaria ruscifolia]|uniref:4Fe-4S dicluster domain-containing protein n=1 Tax=Protofrankia symbiont of Coriaria ruscifolia TaxID=1306542 RepID=UPI001040EB88|nr:ferredoxin family protein [Protofrankia symbiont of Coriaria ruscifolia]
MIEVLLADRCTKCNICVRVCPTNVFDAVAGEVPVIARQEDCQTCFMCEIYCPVDALFVDPDCDGPVEVSPAEIAATDWPGQYRRDSGWGRWRHVHHNESWRMGTIFAEAFEILGIPRPPSFPPDTQKAAPPAVPDTDSVPDTEQVWDAQ